MKITYNLAEKGIVGLAKQLLMTATKSVIFTFSKHESTKQLHGLYIFFLNVNPYKKKEMIFIVLCGY